MELDQTLMTSTPPSKAASSPSRTPLIINTKPKKICSTMALLDQYQEDDDENLTTQLLQSIRSWNLDRPPSTSTTLSSLNSDGTCDGTVSTIVTKGSTAGATVTTATSDDLATITTTSTTKNESFSSTIRSATKPQQQHESNFKTPCRGNYSSRPSFLTERILEDDASYEDMMMVATSTSSLSTESPHNPLNMALVVVEGKYDDDAKNSGCLIEDNQDNEQAKGNDPHRVRFLEHNQRQQHNDIINDQECIHEPQDHQHHTPCITPITKNPALASIEEDNHGIAQRSRNRRRSKGGEGIPSDKAHDDAISTLQEVAASLGLSPENVDAVLPMVRKLVRVVKVHVPRLEQFVESVCQIVESDNIHDDNAGITTDYVVGENQNDRGKPTKVARQEGKSQKGNKGTIRQDQKNEMKRKSKKGAKNMEARRKRMSRTVTVLSEEWPKRCTTEARDHSEVPSDSALFYQAVKEKLNQRHQRQVARIVNNIVESPPLNKNASSSFPADTITDDTSIEDVLDSIDELIKFEERSNRIGTIEKIVSNSSASFGSPSSAFSPRSPTNSDEIIEELLVEDPTILRKIVLHFAYLFSVRQDEMRVKMNELYHFSHEAGALINTVRKAVGVSINCPLSTVSRRVVDAVHKGYDHCGSTALTDRI